MAAVTAATAARRQEELDRCAADHARRLERELALARAEAAAQLGQALEAARAEYHQRVDAEVPSATHTGLRGRAAGRADVLHRQAKAQEQTGGWRDEGTADGMRTDLGGVRVDGRAAPQVVRARDAARRRAEERVLAARAESKAALDRRLERLRADSAARLALELQKERERLGAQLAALRTPAAAAAAGSRPP